MGIGGKKEDQKYIEFKENIKSHLQTLDKDDLGLAHDMNKIFNS